MTFIEDLLEEDVKVVKALRNLTNVKFKCSTGNEFVHDLKLLKDTVKYPFFFINSTAVEYDRQNPQETIVSVGEIVIATKSLPEWTSEQRRSKSFEPILVPFLETFLEQVRVNSQGAVLSEEGKVKLHYFYGKQGLYGTDGNVFEDAVDAIQLLNFKFRIL